MTDYDLEDDLLDTIEPGARIFGLSDSQRTQVIGVAIEETEDSFLVALPSVFVVEEGKDPELQLLFRAVPFVRLMKSNITLVSLVDSRVNKIYLDFIQLQVYNDFPNYVPKLLTDLGAPPVKRVVPMGDEDLEEKLEGVLASGNLHDADPTLQ